MAVLLLTPERFLRTLFAVPLAWLQLTRERVRLLVAIAGVVFAIVLIFMQLGFSDALYASAVRFHQHLEADLVLINPHYAYLAISRPFARRRLYQAAGYDGVASVTPVYFDISAWKNPHTGGARNILVIGIDPTELVLDLPGLAGQRNQLQVPDVVLFDQGSRPEYGLRSIDVKPGQPVFTEVGHHRVQVSGVFDLGASFAVDGNLLTSHVNFQRLLPYRRQGLIDIGLIKLKPGANPEAVRATLAANLPGDVDVLTKQGFIDREQTYWRINTPIGYVFTFGVIMSFIVGAVIVYQILFVNVADHLTEYATLKAMGYGDAYLFAVVLQQAVILAVLGYLPGLAICMGLYRLTAEAAHLPLLMTLETSVLVLGLAILMCCLSGTLALRKIRAADPAEMF